MNHIQSWKGVLSKRVQQPVKGAMRNSTILIPLPKSAASMDGFLTLLEIVRK